MKRLLLPLLAALALPNAVNAGDLGGADYKGEHISGNIERLKVFEGATCQRRKVGQCDVKFQDGKLIVDDSRGITPDQVISFSNSEIELFIVYRDSEGIINQARMAYYNRPKKGGLLIKEFFYFMNQGKDIPNNYF